MEHVSKALMKCKQWCERNTDREIMFSNHHQQFLQLQKEKRTRINHLMFKLYRYRAKFKPILVLKFQHWCRANEVVGEHWPLTSLRLAPVTPSLRLMSVPSDLQRGRMWLLFVALMIRWAAMAGTYHIIHSLTAFHLDGKQRDDFRAGAAMGMVTSTELPQGKAKSSPSLTSQRLRNSRLLQQNIRLTNITAFLM